MALRMDISTTSRNSLKHRRSVSPFREAMQIPSRNASTSAVMTDISGGISIVKNGVRSLPPGIPEESAFGVMRCGKTVSPTAKLRSPEHTVAT